MTNQLSETVLSGFDAGGDQQDELFEVLSHPHRRAILHYLHNSDTPASVRDLTAELVTWTERRTASDRTGDDRDVVEGALVHNHLPRMAEAGLVSYDDARQTVTLADRTAEVRAHLETMAAN